MAIGDLTLDGIRAERIGRRTAMITGSISVAGTTATAGVLVDTASAVDGLPAGTAISDLFASIDAVILDIPAATSIASKHTTFRFDSANDKIYVYSEDADSGVTTVSNAETCVGTVNFVAYGQMR